MTRLAATLANLLLLAGCDGSNEGTVGNVSAEEAAQVDNAAEMLDASPDSLTAPEDMPLESESNTGTPAGNAG